MKFKKTISILIILTMLFAIPSVFGATNTVDPMGGGLQESIMGFLGNLLSVTGGALISPLISLCFVLLMVIFFAISFLLAPTTSGQSLFPFADQIVYNRLKFFDPNFINPESGSVVHMIGDIIRDMYFSFNILAATVFLIIAMVIGLKLAISTIASEKAHYKEALNTWISGLVILICLPFLIAGIFAVNEKIVEIAYTAVAKDTIVIDKDGNEKIIKNNISFTIPATKAAEVIAAGSVGGVIGGTKGAAIGIIASNLITGIIDKVGIKNDLLDFNVNGFAGLIFKYMALAAIGDFAALIITGILIGQSVALVILYLRRLFYCIILGMLSPLVVAMDVYKKGI